MAGVSASTSPPNRQSNLARSIRIFGTVFANPGLCRTELAFIGFNIAEYGTWIAIMVFAYGVGGAAASGTIGAAQLLPAAIFAPCASVLGDRFRRDRVLVGGYLAQALTVALAGGALLGRAPLPLICVLAAAATTSFTLTRPVQGALLPSLAETADQLTAANVAAGWIEGFSLFVGPLGTGVLLIMASPAAVFVVMAAVLLCSAVLAAGIRAPHSAPAIGRAGEEPTILQNLMAGFHTLTQGSGPRLIVSLMGVNFLLVGALDIVLVVLAFRQLGTGSGGTGFLYAAFGAGGLLGAAGSVLLVGRRRLALPLVLAALSWGFGLSLLSAGPNRLLAPLLIVLAGAGRSVFDVTGRTLLQRVVPGHVMSRVFGILEGLYMAAAAGGLILVPALFAILRDQLSFITVGAFLPAAVLLTWRRLGEVDATAVVATARLALLRSVSIFSLLSPPIAEWLAARLIPVEATPGTMIIRQGERGDRFYVISQGWVTVSVSGETAATLGPADYFGEIALLHDVPRTADVVAETLVELFALERADFLEAVTGHPGGVPGVQAMSQARLAAQREERMAKQTRG